MDHQQAKLITKTSDSAAEVEKKNEPREVQQEKKQVQQQEKQASNQPLDIIKQLAENQNPLPLLAVVNQVDLYTRTNEGVPLFNLLMNKFLPLSDLLENCSIKFEADADGRTPLHYAVQADDVKAVQWLLSKGANNVKDKFGYSPVMESVKLGHKRCFLLFLHYQHINVQLPHIAAQFNRVWELRFMISFGINVSTRLNQANGKTPLEVAVANYSYEAAQFLASLANNQQMNLRSLTDSNAIIRRVTMGLNKSSFVTRAVQPFVINAIEIMIIIATVIFSPFMTDEAQIFFFKLIGIFLALKILMIALFLRKRPKVKNPENIMKLLHEPYFPNTLDHICPSCINRYHPQKQDHCDVCHTCVPKFHKHTYICINKSNQLFWYLSQYLLCYLLFQLISEGVSTYLKVYPIIVPTPQTANIEKSNNTSVITQASMLYSLVYTIYSSIFLQWYLPFGVLMIYLCGLLLQQVLVCLQLFGMAFMDRTYQQTIRTQDYPHLYRVFKSKSGKMKTREQRIFLKYKICGGVCMGIRNIITYFF